MHSVILAIDSPGGEVDGVQALANDVFAARAGSKPIVAVADGVMASGAYWIGSAAEKLYITGDTTAVGSIGVIAKHTDLSKAQEMRGVKVTDITAGKYKAVASPNAPLSQEGRQSIQEIVDHIYSVFVDDVARNRAASSTAVLERMADGRLFLGKNAVQAGLVDGIATLEQVIADLNATRGTGMTFARAAAAAQPAIAAARAEPAREDDGLAERLARLQRAADANSAPAHPCITPRELLPPPAPKLQERDAHALADRARELRAILGNRISIERATQVAMAETSRTLPEAHIVGCLAQVEIAEARQKGMRFADVPDMQTAVATVRARWGATANEAV